MAQRQVSPILLLLTAPSGAGKTTVGRNLLESNQGFQRAITCTTRAPRPGEVDGVDYHFLRPEDFERRLAAGEFLEHALVYGHRYGTLRSEVLDRLRSGADVLLTVDVQGAEAIRRMARSDPAIAAALVSVFLMPPSLPELERRLRRRNQDSAEVIQRRLSVAHEEIEHWPHFDYVIVSGPIEDDLAAMLKIVAAERLRASRTTRFVLS